MQLKLQNISGFFTCMWCTYIYIRDIVQLYLTNKSLSSSDQFIGFSSLQTEK